jgi:uncharacterized protein YijF (DUF1287 family)
VGWIVIAGLLLITAAELGTGHFPTPKMRRARLPTGPRGEIARKIVEGARGEVERHVRYDASYQLIHYPGGDIPADRGACTDVLVRALRNAGFDFQQLIHDDMRRHFRRYPQKYGLRGPDPSIDHRRASNHVVFLRRHGKELPRATQGLGSDSWQPGDLIYWGEDRAPWHCGVISDRLNAKGLPLVIHNVGGAREEDVLAMDRIAGHFRYPVEPPRRSRSH